LLIMKILALILKSLVLVAVFTATSGVVFAATRPNVVIFLADDSGWGDYSISGNTQVRTPNIDSIARGVLADARGVSHGALSSAHRRARRLDGTGAVEHG
jgi:hypothetical protein